MRPSSRRRSRFPTRSLTVALGLALAFGLAGCSDDDNGGPTEPDPEPAISLTLAPGSRTITQGESAPFEAVITRIDGFEGVVTVAVSGAPDGVTVTPDPASIDAGATRVEITLDVAADADPGATDLTVTASGSGVTDQTETFQLQVEEAPAPPDPDYDLSLDPSTIEISQGTSGTVTVNVNRIAGFDETVTLAVDSPPSGMAATFDPADVTGDASTLTLDVPASAATGSVSITVQGTSTGGIERSVDLPVTITEGGSGGAGAIAWTFCEETGLPEWVAVQDGDGPWSRVTPEGDTYRFDIDETRGAIAFVIVDDVSGAATTTVLHLSSFEFEALAASRCTGPGITKTVNGSVADLAPGEIVNVGLGSASATVVGGAASTFTLTNVPDGPQDLIAGRQAFSGTGLSVDRLLIRRDLNPADGSTLAPIDFDADGFDPVSGNVTVAGLSAGDEALFTGFFISENGTFAPYVSGAPLTGGAGSYVGIPNDRLDTGDLHYLQVIAGSTDGDGSFGTARTAVDIFREVSDRTLELGPVLATPALTVESETPFVVRAEADAQAEYDDLFSISLSQVANTVSLIATTGWRSAAPTWDLRVPDLSSTAGWDGAWGLQSGSTTSWAATGSGWTTSGGILGTPFEEGGSFLTAFTGGELD
jgi:hypothetical protein